MAFIPAPNAIRICLQFEWTGQIVEICIGILKNAGVAEEDLTDVAESLELWRRANLRPLQTTDITATQWVATSLASETAPSIILPIDTNPTGSNASGSVPNNVTLVTTFLTALRGRSYRGRVYTPGLAQDQMATAVAFSDATAAALTVAYAAIDTYLSPGFVHCVLSYQNSGAARTSAARTPITGYRTEVNVDSQRRRLETRGD